MQDWIHLQKKPPTPKSQEGNCGSGGGLTHKGNDAGGNPCGLFLRGSQDDVLLTSL